MEIPITPVKAGRVRLSVAESSNAININEFQVFPPMEIQSNRL
jgi:hypothetical protein